MAHHAYYFAGEREQGIATALAYGERELGLTAANNPDVIVFRYGLFSVDDARRVIRLGGQASVGERKLIVIAVERFFHEAQNALLKLFEEPSPGTTLALIVPSAGILLPTLRSRMVELGGEGAAIAPEAEAFIAASSEEREKLVGKLIDRAKSDKDEDKQAARGEALRIVEGLLVATYTALRKRQSEELVLFARDLDRFIPILHERSAPLKLIFEHVLITMPALR